MDLGLLVALDGVWWEDGAHLAEFADVSDLLALQRAEVLGDTARLEVHHTGERLIEQGADGGDGEVTGLGLQGSQSCSGLYFDGRVTHRQGVDHGLETHVDLSATDDLGNIGRVVGLEQSNLQTFILEVASALGEIEGGVVRGGVPANCLAKFNLQIAHYELSAYQLVRKVILSVDMMIFLQAGISVASMESVCPMSVPGYPCSLVCTLIQNQRRG